MVWPDNVYNLLFQIPKTKLDKELSNLVWLKAGPAFSSGLDQMTSRGNPQPKLSCDMKVKGLLKKLLSSASLSTLSPNQKPQEWTWDTQPKLAVDYTVLWETHLAVVAHQ